MVAFFNLLNLYFFLLAFDSVVITNFCSDSSEVAAQVLDSGFLKELSSLFEAEVIDLEAVVWEAFVLKIFSSKQYIHGART